jgi:hypothetical protein
MPSPCFTPIQMRLLITICARYMSRTSGLVVFSFIQRVAMGDRTCSACCESCPPCHTTHTLLHCNNYSDGIGGTFAPVHTVSVILAHIVMMRTASIVWNSPISRDGDHSWRHRSHTRLTQHCIQLLRWRTVTTGLALHSAQGHLIALVIDTPEVQQG